MQDFTLHTHTNFFDGRNTPEQMITQAQSLGFRAIGISDHFIVHPHIKQAKFYRYARIGGYDTIYSESFDVALAKFVPHYEHLRRLGDKLDIQVLCGMEVDYFHHPRWRDGFVAACKKLRPDYLIGSAHFVEHNGALCNIHDMLNAPDSVKHEMLQNYWYGVSYAAESDLFDWMAHLDLPKKVGLGTDDMYAKYEEHAVRSIAKTDGAMELNTRAPDGVYPSDRILKLAARHNVPVLISDDAHDCKTLGNKFNAGEEKIALYGLRKLTLQDILSRHRANNR